MLRRRRSSVAPLAEEQLAGDVKRRREEVMRRSTKLKMVGLYIILYYSTIKYIDNTVEAPLRTPYRTTT